MNMVLISMEGGHRCFTEIDIILILKQYNKTVLLLKSDI